jgi:ABC-type amino acid transport substrate-binding protein
MGRDVVFNIASWHDVMQQLADRRIDVLPLVARTPARLALFEFTAPYLTVHGSIIVRKGAPPIRQPADLHDRIVVVMKSDTADEYVRQHHLSDRIRTTETLEEALRELADGRHDAMVAQTLAAENLIRTLGLTNLEIVGPPLAQYQDFCFAVRKGDRELLALLNEGLSLVIANGTRDRLHEKWIAPTHDERLAQLRAVAAVVVGTLLAAGLLAYGWLRSLRSQVRARTLGLAAANA